VRRAVREDERARARAHGGRQAEAIPGFRVELTTDEFIAQVREVGLAIAGRPPTLCRRTLLYAPAT
jgi:thymidine phosphorylase